MIPQQGKGEIIHNLREKLKEYPGRFESDEEIVERYRYELIESKKILEEKLSKEIGFLCWPGGGYNDLSLKIAIEAGYRASTIASRESSFVVDNSGDYKIIRRFGLNSIFHAHAGVYFQRDRNWVIKNFLNKRSNHFFYKNYFRAFNYGYRIMELLIKKSNHNSNPE